MRPSTECQSEQRRARASSRGFCTAVRRPTIDTSLRITNDTDGERLYIHYDSHIRASTLSSTKCNANASHNKSVANTMNARKCFPWSTLTVSEQHATSPRTELWVAPQSTMYARTALCRENQSRNELFSVANTAPKGEGDAKARVLSAPNRRWMKSTVRCKAMAARNLSSMSLCASFESRRFGTLSKSRFV